MDMSEGAPASIPNEHGSHIRLIGRGDLCLECPASGLTVEGTDAVAWHVMSLYQGSQAARRGHTRNPTKVRGQPYGVTPDGAPQFGPIRKPL